MDVELEQVIAPPMTPEATQLSAFVDSLIVPIKGDEMLLLPVSAVAEVVDRAEFHPAGEAPPWFYGEIEWRGQRHPLISFEALIGGEAPERDEGVRYAMIKSSGYENFYAIISQGYPRSARITPTSDFRAEREKSRVDGLMMYASLDEQSVVMPDLAYIESELREI